VWIEINSDIDDEEIVGVAENELEERGIYEE